MITMQPARAMIASAEEIAQNLGVAVNIAVLDGGGHLKAFSRMDGAMLGEIDTAKCKAMTALMFNVQSEAVWDACKPGAPTPGLGRL